MKFFISKTALLFFIMLLITAVPGIANSKKKSIRMKCAHHIVYFKFKNTNCEHANITIMDINGEEKFFIENANVSTGEFSILIPSCEGSYIVNVSAPGISVSEIVTLKN